MKGLSKLIMVTVFVIFGSNLVLAQITSHEQNVNNSALESSNLVYISEPFETLKFNITGIIDNADSYLIRFSQSCLGISVGDCIRNGSLNEWFQGENNSENKTLGVNIVLLKNDETGQLYNETYIGIGYSTERYKFEVSPFGMPRWDTYVFRVYFTPIDKNIGTEDAAEIISKELKGLGMTDENTKIVLKEEYVNPPTQHSGGLNQIESILTNNKYSFFIITILIILMLVIAYFIKKRHGK